MPYISTDGNRYLGEHSCNHYHYGNQTIVRNCCVEDAVFQIERANKNAFTRWHPAYQMATSAWNSLTDTEMRIVESRVTFEVKH